MLLLEIKNVISSFVNNARVLFEMLANSSSGTVQITGLYTLTRVLISLIMKQGNWLSPQERLSLF